MSAQALALHGGFRSSQHTGTRPWWTIPFLSTMISKILLWRFWLVGSKPDLEMVMRFHFQPLVHRMVDKYQWDENKAEEVFADMKRFLYIAAISDGPVAPSEAVDEVWHNFILFTEDYQIFCLSYFGRIIHHRPRRRNDQPVRGQSPIQRTVMLAKKHFGEVPKWWVYRKKTDSDCEAACNGHCSPSTNCQSG